MTLAGQVAQSAAALAALTLRVGDESYSAQSEVSVDSNHNNNNNDNNNDNNAFQLMMS